LFDITSEEKEQKQSTICYCRVSSSKQKDDLARQVVFMREKFPSSEIIQDIGSGINYKRNGIKTILERLLQGEKLTVVVAFKDRLARFGTEIFKFLIEKNGGEFLVLNDNKFSPERELTEDLLAILTVFSCRMHGLRRYKQEIKENKDLS
jgi:putative resolvase